MCGHLRAGPIRWQACGRWAPRTCQSAICVTAPAWHGPFEGSGRSTTWLRMSARMSSTMARVVIGAAREADVEHLVFHSVLHPQIEAMPHHWQKMRVEELLLQSGLHYTILQPTIYMQNILASWDAISQNGVYPVPYAARHPLESGRPRRCSRGSGNSPYGAWLSRGHDRTGRLGGHLSERHRRSTAATSWTGPSRPRWSRLRCGNETPGPPAWETIKYRL